MVGDQFSCDCQVVSENSETFSTSSPGRGTKYKEREFFSRGRRGRQCGSQIPFLTQTHPLLYYRFSLLLLLPTTHKYPADTPRPPVRSLLSISRSERDTPTGLSCQTHNTPGPTGGLSGVFWFARNTRALCYMCLVLLTKNARLRF